MFRFRRKKKRRVQASSVTKHYTEHKEAARTLIVARLVHYNVHYNLQWKRVAIRNQRRCWGSCSSLKNLNFSYKILFLPPHLQDYIVVHELCHLQELHHKKSFWDLVAETVPEWEQCVKDLKAIEKQGMSIAVLAKAQELYQAHSAVSRAVA